MVFAVQVKLEESLYVAWRNITFSSHKADIGKSSVSTFHPSGNGCQFVIVC